MRKVNLVSFFDTILQTVWIADTQPEVILYQGHFFTKTTSDCYKECDGIEAVFTDKMYESVIRN